MSLEYTLSCVLNRLIFVRFKPRDTLFLNKIIIHVCDKHVLNVVEKNPGFYEIFWKYKSATHID